MNSNYFFLIMPIDYVMSCDRVCLAAISRYWRTPSPPAPLGGLQVTWLDVTWLDLHCLSPLSYHTHTLTSHACHPSVTVAVHCSSSWGGGGGGGGGGEGLNFKNTALPAMFYFHSFCRWLVSCWTYFTLNYQLIHCLPFKWWPLNPSLVAYLSTQPPLYFSSIVWSTSVTQSRRLCGLSDEEFLLELNTALQRPSEVDRWSPLYTGNNVSIIITLLCHVSDCIWAHQPIPYSLPWFHPWTLLIITYSHTI